MTRDELQAALDGEYRTNTGWVTIRAEHYVHLIEAGRMTINTLPRTKEIEVEFWATMDSEGHSPRVWDSQYEANKYAAEHDRQVIRLTGAATVRA